MTNARNVIYTYLVGDYDTLKEPEVLTMGWDYVCFTNNLEALRSKTWGIRPLPVGWAACSSHEGIAGRRLPKKIASRIKIEHYNLVDSSYDTVITMDASMTVTGNLNKFVTDIGFVGHDFMAYEHPERDCVYEEAEAVMAAKYEHAGIVNAQMKRYREEGYPENNGLWLGGLTVRRNDSHSLRRACQIWSREYARGGRRDQLSLNYAFWKSASEGHPVIAKGRPCTDSTNYMGTFRVGPHREGTKKELS